MKNIIVPLGAGRSGTSLVMHILCALGMKASDKMIAPRYHNPLGPMEDLEIANVFDQEILPAYSMNRLLPVPLGQRSGDIAGSNRGFEFLKNIIESRLLEIPEGAIWGFKDPVISNFLPQVLTVFNQIEVVPTFVLCVRNPSSVVSSRSKNFKTDSALSELAWLTNTVNAIKETGADCFILHYEDLLSDKNGALISSLAEFTHLDVTKLQSAQSIVKLNLNRNAHSEYVLKNKSVGKLYTALKKCCGEDFDRDMLLDVVNSCYGEMKGYQGWLDFAYEAIGLKIEKEASKEKFKHMEVMSKENKAVRDRHEALSEELRKLGRDVLFIDQFL